MQRSQGAVKMTLAAAAVVACCWQARAFVIPPTDFPVDTDYDGSWWPYKPRLNLDAAISTVQQMKVSLNCSHHYGPEVCDHCKPCTGNQLPFFTIPQDRVCFDLYTKCLAEKAGAAAAETGETFVRDFLPAPTLTHFKGRSGLCTNQIYQKPVERGTGAMAFMGGMRGYSFDFESEFAMQFSTMLDAYIKIDLIAPFVECGAAEVTKQFIGAVGYQRTQELPQSQDTRLSERNMACFNVPPQFPVLCQYRATKNNGVFLECPAADVFAAVGELLPGDKITIVMEVNMICGDRDLIILPPATAWEVDILRTSLVGINSNALVTADVTNSLQFPVCAFFPDEVDGGLAGALFEPILASQMARHSWVMGVDDEECGELGGRLLHTQEELDRAYGHLCDIKTQTCGCLQSKYRRDTVTLGYDLNQYCYSN